MTREQVDAEGELHASEIWRPDLSGKHPHFAQYSTDRAELKLETSLPKVLHEQNFGLLSARELDHALDEVSNRMSDWVGSQIPHASDWDIRGRADAVFAWQAGKRVADYLHAFHRVELPRHYSEAVDREATIYWRNKARVIRLYDKGRETGLSAARGLLRFEVQMNRAKTELGKRGAESIRARDVLDWEHSRAVLSRYLDGLGADLVVTSEEKLFELLREKCGFTKAIRLMGFISVSRMYGRDELIARGFSRKTLWRNAREVRKAGASVGTSKSGLLPPLVLPSVEGYNGKAPLV